MKKENKNKTLKVNIQIRFQEILALTVVIPFLIFTTHVLLGERDYHIIQIYIPLISIILGGYFGQGAIREWKGHKEQTEQPIVEYQPEDPIYEDWKYEKWQRQRVDSNQPPI